MATVAVIGAGAVGSYYGARLALPGLGPIGANGLANLRDFQVPVAAYEDTTEEARLTVKWGGAFQACSIAQSPLDVVAWHGNYTPYKYDLRTLSPVGSVLVDHPAGRQGFRFRLQSAGSDWEL